MIKKSIQKNSRKIRIRAKISGTSDRPRLSVSSTNKHIIAQLIDDSRGDTLAFADDKNSKLKDKTTKAKEVGLVIAKLARDKKITDVVFDRGGKLYHGRVKALAEGAREGGLKF